MIEKIEQESTGICSLTLVSRVINTGAAEFYQKLGFKQGAYQHPAYSPETYVGYKKDINQKLKKL